MYARMPRIPLKVIKQAPLRSLRPPRLIAFPVLNVKCQVLKDVSLAEC